MNQRLLSARRVFWGLVVFGVMWSFAGYRWNWGWMRFTQDRVLAQVPNTLLVPGQFVFGSIQGLAMNAISRSQVRGSEHASPEALQEENDNLRYKIAQLNGLVGELEARNGMIKQLELVGLNARDVLPATVLGPGAGTGSSVLHLDKGTSNGVAVGMVVVAPLEQVTVLGKIDRVGTLESTVRLMDDPAMRTTAIIVRGKAGGEVGLIAENALVQGLGSNQMACYNVNIRAGGDGPQKGDLVQLTDGAWPQSVRYMLIGKIESVSGREDQPLRYDLRITPIRNISAMRTAMIVTKR